MRWPLPLIQIGNFAFCAQMLNGIKFFHAKITANFSTKTKNKKLIKPIGLGIRIDTHFLSKYLNLSTRRQRKDHFGPRVKLPPVYYQSNHKLLKGRDNPVKYLAQGVNKQTCRPTFTLTLLNAEHQAGKVNINF